MHSKKEKISKLQVVTRFDYPFLAKVLEKFITDD